MVNHSYWEPCECLVYCGRLNLPNVFPEGKCMCPPYGKARMRKFVCMRLQIAFLELERTEDHKEAPQTEVFDLR